MGEENSYEKKKLGLDLKMLAIGLILFLAALGTSFFMMKSLMAPVLDNAKIESLGKDKVLSGNLATIPEFTTNINAMGGNRFIKVGISLEVTDKKAQEAIDQYMPVVRDSILTILSSKTAADLDRANWDHLKTEIKNETNAKLGKNYIKNVYFNNFIMQ